jgi:hypothetical protein
MRPRCSYPDGLRGEPETCRGKFAWTLEPIDDPTDRWPDKREVIADIYIETANAVKQRLLTGKKPAVQRLHVDLGAKLLTLDGTSYPVASERALRWVRILAERSPNWVSGKELPKLDPDLLSERTDKFKPALPSKVRDLIDSQTGAGSRIRL